MCDHQKETPEMPIHEGCLFRQWKHMYPGPDARYLSNLIEFVVSCMTIPANTKGTALTDSSAKNWPGRG